MIAIALIATVLGGVFAIPAASASTSLATTIAAPVVATVSGPDTVAPTDDDAADPASQPTSDRPPVTVTDFYPESENLSDCVGLLEKPGCGSDSRGGWRQNLALGLMAVGLIIVFWRIGRGIRANRSVVDASIEPGFDGPGRTASDTPADSSHD